MLLSEVETLNGAVMLSGRVEQSRQRGEAEEIARSTDGVRDVRNRIETGLAPPAPGRPDVGAGPGAGAPARPVD